ncbi:MAG: phosphoribosylformylglycinamidine cyclo-ligase [Candidatus Micrarchaeota archaeon]|nr:phosphoribosylformylglycinamidine cyclo-ligase [Candidatus Micrarchaeota archaeon]
MKYSDAGIDLNKLAKIKKSILSSYEVMLKGHFSSVVPYNSSSYFSIHTDGVGTKTLIAEKLDSWDSIGIDAIAMNVNDMCCINCKPLLAVDYIACKEQNDEIIEKIIKSISKACKIANVRLVGGETAILPDLMKGYDVSATCFGTGKLKDLVTGESISHNDTIIGLKSSGMHSNGYSLARKVLDIEKFGKELLKPTIIYSPYVLQLCKKIKVKGIAHITGNAFTKIKRLNNKFDFVLNNMPKPFGIFKALVESIKDEKELYSVFNMGIGMIIVVNQEDENTAIDLAKKFGIEALNIGHTEKGIGKIKITTFSNNQVVL